jgi:O-antigen/teichoic acid export membrane protein
LSLGSWIQLGAVLALVQAQMDKVLLGTFAGLAPAGAYEISARVVAVATLPAFLFLGALFPAMSEREAASDEAARRNLYRAALGPYLLAIAGLTGGLVALAAPLLEAWLGVPPDGSALMLRILSLVALVTLATGVASTLRRAAERAELEVAYGTLNVGLHVALSLVGFRLFGWPGILYGTAVAAFVSSAWFTGRVERWLGWPALAETVRASLPALAATLPAALAAAGVVSLFGGMPPGRARGALALAAGAAAFATVFVAVVAVAFPALAGSFRRRVRAVLGSS